VSATFTSEPVENFILWWGEQFGLPIDLEFAPYNQVFPQLLDEQSLLSINRGINLLLIRFEDWIRDLQLPAEDICDKLEDDFNRLVKIMKEKPKPVPYFAGIFPTASHLSLKPQVRYYIEGLYRRWKKIVTELDNVYPVDFLPLKELYAIGETFDPIADKEGHVPFSGEFYAAMGTAVVRKIYALDHNPFKVVALDCDNTLWRGICGEDGAENVQVAAPYAELQRLMIRLYDEGFLLTLCSKNNESDAWEVFEKNRGMLLRKEHFAGWRINWQPKSANLKALAEELNLGIDSFIFIDDSPVECAETRANCPEVLTLQLPENPASIPLFLKHIWGFDKIKVTAEDRSRTQMYRAEKKRKEAEKDSLTLSNFLGGLQLKISMNFPTPDQAPRISQLTQRTNQFNLSTIRRREDEIARLSEEPGMRVWVIEVSDRFGDYGLVGVVITKEEKESLFIDTFLLSCRVLGREVETAILAGLRRYCAEKQLKSLIARYYPTEKNKPFLKFLQERWHLSEKHGEEYTLFVYPLAETSEAIEFAGIYYLEQFEKKRLPEKPAGEKFAAVEAGVEPATAGGKTVSSPRSQVGWNIDIAAAGNLLHKNHLLPLQYSTAGLLTGLPAYNSHKETRSRAKYEAAGNEVESKLVEIWEKILRIEGIGVNDSFFDSGGNSLKVITLLSEIHKTFNAELTFRDIFDNKTIRQISGLTAGARENLYSAIEAAQEKAYYSMSSAQKRLFILQQLEPASTAYNLTAVLALSGNTDKKRLLDTAKKLIAHQESLRTSFEILAEEPVQRIHNPGDIEFEIEYYEAKNKQEEKDTIARFIRPFDLTQAPLLRIGLIKIETRTHILTISMHHIISDGASSEIFSREFAALYAGKELPPLKIRYKDYSEWLNSPATKEATAKQKQYWLEQFTGEIPVLDLPTDFPRPVKQSFAGHTIKFGIGKEETIRLLDLSKELESTIFMVLSASFNVLLTKLSGREDIVLGSPVLGRMHAGLEGIIGMFVNTLALRNYPGGELTVREFLNRVKQRSIEAFENQDYPFEELVDNLAVRRDLSRNPLFDVMFRLFTYSPSSPAAAERDGEGLRPGNYEYEDRAAIVDLQLTALESADKISFSVEYCTELFKAETIKRFIGYFKKIILSLPHLLDKKIREIEIISAEEKKTILFDFNREQTAYPRSKTIHRLFEEQVQKTPAAIALTMHRPETAGVAVTLTYMELNREADYLARILVEKGIKTGNIAALMVERSIEMMVGIFAVLKAGGAYLPIDPRYPQNRQEYIVKDSNATLLLTARSLEKEVEALRNLQIERIFIDETVRSDLIHQKQSAAALASRSGDPAYVIYTSGSTGLPKGVMIEHHSVNNRLYWMQKGYPLSSDDIILQKTTYTFDVSVWELFWWSFFGAGLCLLTPGGEKDPAAIIDAVVKHRVSTMHFVPSMLDAFLHYIEMQEAPLPPLTLRQVFASGEALKPDQVEKFNRLLHRVHGTNLINLYGPTEATVDVSYFNCYGVEKLDRIPIGKPIDNIRLYILDRALGFQPIGVAGQLYIAGAGLARGYLNRPELTAEKFIASKQEGRTQQLTNSRLIYQTGDLARWLKDGNIEYLGRIDNQVKIRGFRIELGEIENRLAEHARVRQAVVLDKPAPDGDRYLVAYVAAERDIENDLRDFLTQTLPDYMVPGRFVFLPQIPLTSNGKVNRKALPEPEALTGELDYTAPRDAVEEKLVKIWSAVLGLDSENIGIDHNFFHLGGHSLKATILTASIQKALSVKVPLEQIFKTPAIRGLAEFIKSASYDRFYSINDAEKKEYYALSSSQKRLYILQRIDHGSTAYNIPNVMTLTGEVDLQRLRGTFRKLIRRHESLRTSFLMAGGEPVQRVCGAADIEFDIEYYDVESKDQGRAGDFIRSFDLANAPLLRVVLKKIAAAKHVLIVDMHHIISDGVSGRIIAEEFMNLYRGEDLAPIRVQYKDFSEWRNSKGQQEAVKEQGAYWLEQFAGEVPVLNLPGDFSRPPVQSFAGSTVKFELGAEETAVLNRIALDREVTLFMVLLAVFNILLSRLSGQEDIIVGTPTAGRRHADVAGIIGIFINTLGLRNFPMGGKTFVDFLHEVKYTTLKAFENQEYQFEDLVEKVEVKRDVSRNPLFDVLLVLQNMENPEIEIPSGLKLASYEHETGIAKFDLSLYGAEFGEKLGFVVEYCTKLFKKETIIKFVNYFKNLISEVTGDPGKKINEFRLVPEEEMQQVLFGFNDTGVPYEADKTLVRLFEEQAERTPDRVVVVGPDYPETGQDGNTSPIRSLQLTYRLLAEKARCIGDCLREKGVAPDIITGLLVERSLNMITGLLGILKAGGAYLPIDPEYPPERIDYMLRESRAPLLLTTRRSIGDVEKTASSNIETVFIGEIGNREQRLGIGKKQKKEQASGDLAYVIYTSGSTGKPKGVALCHRNVVNFIKGMTGVIDFSPGKTILAITTICFDIFVLEILLPLVSGLKFVIADEVEQKVPGRLARLIVNNGIDMLQFTPSRLNLLLSVDEELKCLSGVGDLMVGGEAFPERLFLHLKEKYTGNIHNMYGPTETAVWSAVKNLTAAEKINIGKPIANTRIFILDKAGAPQPAGIPGELCIGGDGLARGYINRPELTAEKFRTAFIAHHSMQLYTTGDLCRLLPDGEIEFLGRMDYQVKIRGFRIELGEIESALKSYGGQKIIKDAVVIDRDGGDGVKRLSAYIVSLKEVTVSELRSYLSGKLPDYMIPSYFVQIESLPLTPNGKIDKKALAKHGKKLAGGTAYQEPRNAVEEKIAAVWQEFLHLDRVGIHDNYFELGGTSLDIIKVNVKLQETFQKEIPVVAMFRFTTVHSLAGYLSDEKITVRDRGNEVKKGKQNIQALRKRIGVKNG
jgi:amino acid adenylation domain-containing protein/FkbH-like protein